MSTKDAIYWGGFIAGMSITAVVVRELGYGRLWQLLGGLIVGVGTGYFLEKIVSQFRQPPDERFGGDL